MSDDVTGGSAGTTTRPAGKSPGQDWADKVFNAGNPGLPWNMWPLKPAGTGPGMQSVDSGGGSGGTGSGAAGILPGLSGGNGSSGTNPSSNPDTYDPGWRLRPASTWDANEMQQFQAEQAANNNALAGSAVDSAATSAAAALAERQREFDVTTQRDIAKENATEIDSLQKLIAGQTGPKDPYGYLFWSRGLTPPQGYNPTALPFTSAQQAAWLQANPGKSPQDLINTFTGGGKPPGWVDQQGGSPLLGNMPQSLQSMTPPISSTSGQTPSNASLTQSQPTGPPLSHGAADLPPQTVQPTTGSIPGTAQIPWGVPGTPKTPSMAVGGDVPGAPGQPQLTVLHGGEQVKPVKGKAGPPNNSQIHPALQRVLDAISELVSNPDFQQFTSGLQAGQGGPSPAMQQAPPVTPGGVQSMATGGTVAPPPLGVTNPLSGGVPPVGSPQPGNQGIAPAKPLAPDQPIIPMNDLDPYTKALYDRMGRLHPYSAQQEADMGPSGVQAIQNYLGKVAGMDVNDYTDLVTRLKPQAGAPQMGDVQSDGFTTG